MNLLSAVLPYFAPVISPDWTIWPNIQYGATSEEVADLYLLNKGIHPVVVFIHGGGWSAGDKSAYEGRARKYALAGFHVVAINYRLAKWEDPTSQWPAQLSDCQTAIRWLRLNKDKFRIDPYRIGVGGDSAGGHLALCLACNYYTIPNSDRAFIAPNTSPWAQCVLDMFGPTDLSSPGFRDVIATTPLFGGKTFDQIPTTYGGASPLFHIPVPFPPTIIFHGTSDTTVPYAQSVALDQKLTQLGIKHKLVTFNGGHEFGNLSSLDQISLEMQGLDFMREVLRP